MNEQIPAVGIIGGSGLYDMEELREPTEYKVETPFGAPSDSLVGGKVGGRQVYFLPRHSRGHRILQHELNHRANIYALRSLDVRWIHGAPKRAPNADPHIQVHAYDDHTYVLRQSKATSFEAPFMYLFFGN